MKNVCLFLTGCVNPNGMSFTKLNDINIRKQQYIDAINFYTSLNIPYKVLFVENSNCQEFRDIFSDEIKSGKLEFLSFNGNNFDKSLGKGYGEFEIIEYALNNSNFLNDSDVIIKITGRIQVTNIEDIYNNILDLDFPTLFYMSNFRKEKRLMTVWSQVFITNIDTIKIFTSNKEMVNDSEGVSFENVVFDTLKHTKIKLYSLYPIPNIYGICASINKPYSEICKKISTIIDDRVIRRIRLYRKRLHI